MKTIIETHDQIERPQWLGGQQWPFTLRSHPYRNPKGNVINIHYTDEGTGPTIVLVHAGMWSFVWRDVIAAVRTEFRCITLDFPGSGLSEGDRGDISLEGYPHILESVLDACDVGTACFVVHDLGGVVGILAAASRPDRATGLVVANSFSWPADRFALRAMLTVMGSRAVTWSLGSLRLIPRLTRGTAGVGRNFESADRQAFFGPYRDRSTSRNFHRTMRSARGSGPAFERAEQALLGPLSHLPVLTIFGEKNDPFGFAERWRELFPTARQWTVDNGNHFPMCDDPAGFVDQFTQWHQQEVTS